MTVSPNSANAYNTLIKGDLKENGQDGIILAAFVAIGKPATARMVQKFLRETQELDWESSVMSRSINNLKGGKDNKKPVRIVKFKDDHCEVTGVKVAYYEAILKLKDTVK